MYYFVGTSQKMGITKKPSVVSVYEYLPSEGLKVLEFTEMTDEWLDFIVNFEGGQVMIMI